eukprot:TRINITY_DN11955_c0_g1_i1.p1 TRINITY_DN11955_c0_g1~~TRINITY_DN11955_c0_g1_i1.p1  ORF type:complete len:436 (+),score=186.91 TRINITY_DN11955_c0_g1_i1:136-1443(+)
MTVEGAEEEQQYYIVQVYVRDGGKKGGQAPLILRVGNESLGRDVLSLAVERHNKEKEKTTAEKDWTVVSAKGDGSPDLDAPKIEVNTLLSNQGLTFPYMLCMLPVQPTPTPEPVPLDACTKAAPLPASTKQEKQTPEKDANKDPQTEQSRKKIKEYIQERQAQVEALQKKRDANVAKILSKRAERERKHLESCEKHEIRRKERVENEKKAVLEVQKEEAEAVQRKMLERQLEEERRHMEESKVLNEVREEAARETVRRTETLTMLEKARESKLQAERAKRKDDAEKRRRELEHGRSERMNTTLASVLDKLTDEIGKDAKECEEKLAKEREERAQQDRENYERRYVERLEKEKSMVKERERHLRLTQEKKQNMAIQLVKEKQAQQAADAKQLDETHFKKWKANRQKMIEEDQAVREQVRLVKIQSEKSRLPAIPTC